MAYYNIAIAAYGAYTNYQKSQSGSAAAGGTTLNVSKAISDAQTQQANDLQNSINLENQFLPGQAANRSAANSLNQQVATGNTLSQGMQNELLRQAGSSITNPGAALNNPLTSAANSSILQSLNMGGQLDPATEQAVTQGALQGAGSAGISGSGAGRGLVARDLGLTSLQLLQSRQQQASAAGNAYGALGLQAQGLQLQDYLSRVGALSSAVGLQDQYALGFGALMNQTTLPNSGLSGSQVASLDVGNTNIINGAAQQQAANQASGTSGLLGSLTSLFGGSGGGGGLAGLFSSFGGGGGSGTTSTIDPGGESDTGGH